MSIEDYLPKEFTDERKKQIVELVKNEVDIKNFARIGFHAEEVLNIRKGDVNPSTLSRIRADVRLDHRYLVENHPTFPLDFQVTKNPSYEFEENVKTLNNSITITNKWMRIWTGINALAAAGLLATTLLKPDKQPELRLTPISESLKEIRITLESTQACLRELADSIQKKPDTIYVKQVRR